MAFGIHITCDDPVVPKQSACMNRYYRNGTNGLHALREHARYLGWAFVDGKDYCPKHNPEKRKGVGVDGTDMASR